MCSVSVTTRHSNRAWQWTFASPAVPELTSQSCADWVSVQAKEHGILDTLKAVIHTLEVPLADGGAVGTQSGVAAEVELI